MSDWSTVASVIKKATVAAAKEGTAAAVGGGPQGAAAGAAAGAIAESVVTELLGEYVDAQAAQFARIEQLNHEMNDRLLALQQGVQKLLDGPVLEARLLLEQAAADRTMDRREQDLIAARNAFFRALSLAQTDGGRAVIAEQLSVVCLLDGDRDRGRLWLSKAQAFAAGAVHTQSQIVENSMQNQYKEIDQLLRTKEGRHYFGQGGWGEDYGTTQEIVFYDLPSGQAIIRELNALIEFTNYCNSLRRSCVALDVDMSQIPELEVDVSYGYCVDEVPYQISLEERSS